MEVSSKLLINKVVNNMPSKLYLRMENLTPYSNKRSRFYASVVLNSL